MQLEMNKYCAYCQIPIRGRVDKKFCSSQCRASFHYQTTNKERKQVLSINRILLRNRRLLLHCSSTPEKDHGYVDLLDKGFQPHFCTGYFKDARGQSFFLCYDFAYWLKPCGKRLAVMQIPSPNILRQHLDLDYLVPN